MNAQIAFNIFDAINLQSITFVNIAIIAFFVIEGFLIALLAYNLIRYKYLGSKWFYFVISLIVCFLFCYYINNHDAETLALKPSWNGLFETAFDTFKTVFNSIDKSKLEFLSDTTKVANAGLFSFLLTAASVITLAYLSISLILGYLVSFKNGAFAFGNKAFRAKDIYYLFTDSKNETVIPLAKQLLKEGGHSVTVFVTRASLKTQEGNEFKDKLVGLGIHVRAENFSQKLCKKLIKSNFLYLKLAILKKHRKVVIYGLLSSDDDTTELANNMCNAITENKTFINRCYDKSPNLSNWFKYHLPFTKFPYNKDIKFKKLTEKDVKFFERLNIFITYQYVDVDLIHNFSGRTAHIISTLSKYDMISDRLLFDFPISKLINMNDISFEKDNNHMHVTFFGFGVINTPIFEKMSYAYQLYGDNINKVNYHIVDRDSESLVEKYKNEYTDKNNNLYLYSIEADLNGKDIRYYSVIEEYVKRLAKDPNRFQKDGFEMFVISVINTTNDLNIAENLRATLAKYISEDRLKSTYILVRVAENYIADSFKQKEIAANKCFDKNPGESRSFHIYNSLVSYKEQAAKQNIFAPIIPFGTDTIMYDYLSKQYDDYFIKYGQLAYKSYQSTEQNKANAFKKWLIQTKQSVNQNTTYVQALRTKLNLLGLDVDPKTYEVIKPQNFKNPKLLDTTSLTLDDIEKPESLLLRKIASMEHNRWAQDNNLHKHYLVEPFDKNDTTGKYWNEGYKSIETKSHSGTHNICMVTNAQLKQIYIDLRDSNTYKEHEREAFKFAYGNDINQLKVVLDDAIEIEKNKKKAK